MSLFITHAVYLNKFWKEKKYPEDYLKDGILGSFLPDIRYLTRQERKITHLAKIIPKDVTYEHLFNILLERLRSLLTGPDTDRQRFEYFKKGVAFHILLDYWWPRQIYFPSSFKYFGTCLKFADEIIRWPEFKEQNPDFEPVLPYSVHFLNLSDEIVKKWYAFIFQYLSVKPTPESIRSTIVKAKLFDKALAINIEKETKKIAKNDAITNRLDETFNNFLWYKIATEKVLTEPAGKPQHIHN